MLRKICCALFMLALCVGISFADEFNAVITKVGDGKVTFAKTKFNKETKKLEKGDEQTLAVADNVKVVKAKFNKDTKKTEAGDPIEGGLKASVLAKIGEKGVPVQIVTDGDNKKVVEIRVREAKKKDNK